MKKILRLLAWSAALAVVLVHPFFAGVRGAVVKATGSDTSGEYRFTTDGEDGPLRWRTCTEVPVLVNPGPAQGAGVDEVEQALAKISSLTGVRFRVVGTTDAVPQTNWSQVGARHSSWPFPAVLIAWVPDAATNLLDGDSAATVANPANFNGVRQLVSGAIAINTDQFERFRPGFGAGSTRGNLLLHELGHLVGLDHVRTAELMNPRVDETSPDGFGSGDLAGLGRLSPGC